MTGQGPAATRTPWSHGEFEARLRAVGEGRYHDRHPFHIRMNAGKLSRAEIRRWVVNRYYYQKCIPQKDAAILSMCPHRDVRRIWLHRITDHDGTAAGGGGIEAWLRLAEACGLSRDEVMQERDVLPGVRFAVEAYVTLARTSPWPVAVASSLTELFAPDLMKERIAAFERSYKWVPPWGLDYFRTRVPRARSDSDEALELTMTWCNTIELQEEAARALSTKCDILWAVLDSIALGPAQPAIARKRARRARG